MAALPVIAAVATLASAGVSAYGTIAAGKAQDQAAKYEAAQLDIEAKNRKAESQIEAGEISRRKDLALSNLQANAAASGFSATDPTALAKADEIARYGTFQEQLAQYGGTSQRAGLEAQAEARRFTGKAQRIGSRYSAAGTILGGIGSAASGFSGGGSSFGSGGNSWAATIEPTTPRYRYG